MKESNKGKMYSCMMKNFGKEKYLDLLTSNLLQYLIWFKTANHKLAVETGRWGKINLIKEYVICVHPTKS